MGERVAHVARKPSMKSYWLRWASSAITTMLRPLGEHGWRSPLSSGKNFWIVVKTTPPEADSEFGAQIGAVGGLRRRLAWRKRLRGSGRGTEELIVQVVAVVRTRTWGSPSLDAGSRRPA